MQSIIQAFALHSYILLYPMILLADSEGPDQIADAQADLGHHCPHTPDTFSNGMAYIMKALISQCKYSFKLKKNFKEVFFLFLLENIFVGTH